MSKHLKCRKCHHEWDGKEANKCDWCGADKPRVLEQETAFSRFVKTVMRTGMA